MDLSRLSFEEIYQHGILTLKPTLYTPKSNWISLNFNGTASWFQSLDSGNLARGETALWMQPYVDFYGAKLAMFSLDVEHPDKHHESISANIEAGRILFHVFEKYKIDKDLIVALSGNGLRFILPYLIPYDHTDAFLDMIKDSRNFPGIDPGPQRSNQFFRFLSFRGNKKQSSPPQFVHIEALDKASDILTLSEEQYRELVRGRPDVDRYKEIFPRLLPNQWASDELMEVLETYQYRRRLKSTIIQPSPRKSSQSYTTNWDQIYEHLDEAGITSSPHKTAENITIYKLSECPSCGAKKGSPYLTESGKLHCFRANKCEAGQEKEVNGKTVRGLLPTEWVPGYSAIAEEGEAPEEKTWYSLDQAREDLAEAMQTDSNRCFSVTPGVGKTVTALQVFLPQSKDKLILYTAPTNKLSEEVMEKAAKMANDMSLEVNLHLLEGRNGQNCCKHQEIEELTKRGFTPAFFICPGCSDKGTCEYEAQFKALSQLGMVFCSHHLARYLVDKINPQIWIIDENPGDAFFEKLVFEQAEMDQLQAFEPETMHPLFNEIRMAANRLSSKVQGFKYAKIYATEAPPAVADTTFTLSDISPKIQRYLDMNLLPDTYSRIKHHDTSDFQWERKVYNESISLMPVKWWDALLNPENEDLATINVSKHKGRLHIEYVCHKFNPPQFENCQLIHLDGTMYQPEVEAMFPDDTEIVDIQVSLDHCQKTYLKLSRGKIRSLKLSRERKKEDLEMLLGHLREEDRKVLLLTFKGLEKEILEKAQVLRPDLEFGVYHFFGPKGTNEFEDFDACIAYGTPTVNQAGKIDQAMLMFEEESEIDNWTHDFGRRDLVQAIHRIRPIHGSKNIIVMGSYWPAEYLGHPDISIDMMRKKGGFEGALERLRWFVEKYGFISKEIANVLGVGTREDKTRIQAWQEWLRKGGGVGSDFVPTLINVLYKSGDKIEGDPPAIFLPGNTEWKKLIDTLQVETNLPRLSFKATGKGRPSLGLGRLEDVENFYKENGAEFNPGQFKEG